MDVTIRPEEAWQMLDSAGVKISKEKLKQGIRQKLWPWADYIAAEGERQEAVYIIYSMPFASWLAERSPYFDREVQANGRS